MRKNDWQKTDQRNENIFSVHLTKTSCRKIFKSVHQLIGFKNIGTTRIIIQSLCSFLVQGNFPQVYEGMCQCVIVYYLLSRLEMKITVLTQHKDYTAIAFLFFNHSCQHVNRHKKKKKLNLRILFLIPITDNVLN